MWRPAPFPKRRGLAIVAVAWLLAGCGGGRSGDGSGTSFDTVKQMVAVMRSAGVLCSSLHASKDLIASDAGHCTVGGVPVNLDIYGSRHDRDRAITAAKELVSSGAALVGPNWTVGAVGARAQPTMKKIQAALGGDVEAL